MGFNDFEFRIVVTALGFAFKGLSEIDQYCINQDMANILNLTLL